MEQSPETIQRQIRETQERMGDTVEALAYKTDVPARAKDAVGDGVDAIRQNVADAVDSARSAVGGASAARDAVGETIVGASGAGLNARFDAVASFATRNPLGLAIGSVAAGFLVGLALPTSDLEREQVGSLGEQVADQAKLAAGHAIEQGKSVVTRAVNDVVNAPDS